jgi:hypothetical protein
MMLHTAFQNVASDGTTVAASGIAHTSLYLAGVSTLLVVHGGGALTLPPTSV